MEATKVVLGATHPSTLLSKSTLALNKTQIDSDLIMGAFSGLLVFLDCHSDSTVIDLHEVLFDGKKSSTASICWRSRS